MVSFQCESCGDVLTKKKLDPHRGRCRGASFSCIDCMTYFNGTDYRSHTTCMTEDQKYQGALYKNKNKKARFDPPSKEDNNTHFATPATPAPAATSANMAAAVRQYYQPPAHAAFVEDVPEELESYLVADNDENAGPSDDDAPPHAPTPPPADEADDSRVNVFDFLVGATPNGSSLELAQAQAAAAAAANPSGMGFEYDVNAFLDSPAGFATATDTAPKRQLIDYGSAPPPPAPAPPLPATAYQTPGPLVRVSKKKDKVSADKETSSKKDKKRKRLYIDLHDQAMADAPPVLHSGLTGGLHRMSTKSPAVYPPSPASAAETPASPLKKTKHTKNRSPRSSDATAGNSLFAILAGAATGSSKSKSSSKKRKHHASTPTTKKHSKTHRHSHSHRHSHRHHHRDEKEASDSKKAPKLLEYKKDGGEESNANNQMVVFKPRADLFMSFVDKGADSERGCSMNKALKRFHRERSESGNALVKSAEEKELFRSLRLRRNDRGEIVLFCIEDDEER